MAKLAKLTAGDYAPEFSLAWALKDVDLSLDSDPRPLPVLTAIAKQWHQAADDGLGRMDVSAARLALAPAALIHDTGADVANVSAGSPR